MRIYKVMYFVYVLDTNRDQYWYLCQFPQTTYAQSLPFNHSSTMYGWRLDLYARTSFPTRLLARMARYQFLKGSVCKENCFQIQRVLEKDLNLDTGN